MEYNTESLEISAQGVPKPQLKSQIQVITKTSSKKRMLLMSKTASARFYRSSKNRVSFRQGVMNLINF